MTERSDAPPMVLVHGAMRGGWIWERLTPLLRAMGHAIFTPTLSAPSPSYLGGRSIDLNRHIQDVTSLIEREELRGIVLVGHSYAGGVILGVAERIPARIRKLVFLDACVPRDGESILDSYGDPSYAAEFSRIARDHGGLIGTWPELRALTDPAGVHARTTSGDADWVSSQLTPQPLATFEQPLRLVSRDAAAIERVYVHCVRNRVAKRPRVPSTMTVVAFDAEHDAMVSAPAQLASLLATLAR